MKRCALLLFVLVSLLPAGAQDAQTVQTQHRAALMEAPLHPQERDPLLEDILATELIAMLNRVQVTVGSPRLALPTGVDQPTLPREERVSHLLAGVDARGADVIVAAFYLAEG
ncbi:MAG TPA: hypothetical protein VMM82_13320, partial [Spirochaetia bacterium]|nr:hypothetical protein [Spirochaetia bacterium]